jgi:ATP-dependent Clp protease protease subunit
MNASKLVPFQRAAGSQWFAIKNATEESADIYLYDFIGDSWVGTDASAVVAQLNALKTKKINLRINSPGGYVFEGFAIYNALVRHTAEVTTYVDGLAASIASVIALAGKKVVIAENAMMMIHDPWVMVAGDSAELRKQADILDQMKESIINTYVTRTGLDRMKIAQMMSDETWFTAQQAIDQKFADEIAVGMKAAAFFDLEQFGYVRAPASVPATHNDQAASASPSAAPAPAEASPSNSPRTTPRSLLHRRQALLEKHNK